MYLFYHQHVFNMLKHLQNYFANVLQHFYLRQLHEVSGGDNVFVRCVCVSVCVRLRSVRQA